MDHLGILGHPNITDEQREIVRSTRELCKQLNIKIVTMESVREQKDVEDDS